MRIRLTSVFVKDQEKALKFYTGTLGFVKKADIPAGDYRWLTVVSPEEPNGTQLVLEPNSNPAAKAYQEAIFSHLRDGLGFHFLINGPHQGIVDITLADDIRPHEIMFYVPRQQTKGGKVARGYGNKHV